MVIKLETKREPLMNTIKLTQTLNQESNLNMNSQNYLRLQWDKTKGRNNLKS